MPQAIPFVVASASAYAAALPFATIGAFAAAGAIRVAVFVLVAGFLSKKLAPKAPELPTASVDAHERKQMVRQPITPWRTIYGEVKVSGPI